MPSWQLVVPNKLNRLGRYDRLLRIHHEVQECIDAVQLIVANRTDGLLTHGTLVRVTRRLIMVRIRHETSHGTQQREALDFQVRRAGLDIMLEQRDIGVVLLVYVEVLDKSVAQKVVKRHGPCLQLVDVR